MTKLRRPVRRSVYTLDNNLLVLLEYLPAVPAEFRCDGCSFVPDQVRGPRGWIDLSGACRQHDWGYALIRLRLWQAALDSAERLRLERVSCNALRKRIDQLFRFQTFETMRRGGRGDAYGFARRRYLGVRAFGGLAIQPDPGGLSLATLGVARWLAT